MTVRVGIFGTSWWADAIYLPPLTILDNVVVAAVCGRNSATTEEFADRWGIPHSYIDPIEMLDCVELDAVIVATTNDTHYDLTMAALERGLHVLCEKPMALNSAQAEAMVDRAAESGAITLVPFTYHYMPVNQFVKRLIEQGFVGRPHHISLRYYAGYGLDDQYSWRFDRSVAGAGVIADLGSHWVHLARWLLGESEVSVSAVASTFVRRSPRPDGITYNQMEDSAVLTVRYESGAYGVLQVSTVCWEGTPFGQTHHLEIHGDAGTIHATCDWDTVQEVRGLRRGETGPPRVMPIPESIWKGVRRDSVHNTYRDVFRNTDAMTRGWIRAIEAGCQITPDFRTGLAVQRVIDGAVASAAAGGTPTAITER